ncbi:hypothetical protein ACFQ61_08015 [Streptomyces sp. NPDC056500]|uniref:hypothetical protein n=1 Tax=Streptomyces sp. NPDC056500 TaxID=3345840 RepID=UPI0036BA5451
MEAGVTSNSNRSHELTEDDVYDHMDNIPAKLRQCAAAKHEWVRLDWTAYTKNGHVLRLGVDPCKAVDFEFVEGCRGCGLRRTFQMAWNHRRRLARTTEYSYSLRNPQLISPRGVSKTDVSVRAEMDDYARENAILRRTITLAPAGATKAALSRQNKAS